MDRDFREIANIRKYLKRYVCLLLLTHIIFVSATHLHPKSIYQASETPAITKILLMDQIDEGPQCLLCTLQRNLLFAYQQGKILLTEPELNSLDFIYGFKSSIQSSLVYTIFYRGPPIQVRVL
jgi:hypothetical protein